MGAREDLLTWVEGNVAIPKYINGGDGKHYRIVPQPGGGEEYVEVTEPGLKFVTLPGGSLAAVRDIEELGRAHGKTSHRDHFGVNEVKEQRIYADPSGINMQLDGIVDQDPTKARQRMKRQDALARQFETMAVERIQPTGPNVEYVSDEKAIDMIQEYQRAIAKGVARDSDFQPLATYERKLKKYNVRPIFQGEVGVKGTTILCLKPGFGTGHRAAVPAAIGPSKLVAPNGAPLAEEIAKLPQLPPAFYDATAAGDPVKAAEVAAEVYGVDMGIPGSEETHEALYQEGPDGKMVLVSSRRV